MTKPNKIIRPTLQERYVTFLEVSELNEIIQMLEIAYQETFNEKVYHVLSKLRDVKKR